MFWVINTIRSCHFDNLYRHFKGKIPIFVVKMTTLYSENNLILPLKCWYKSIKWCFLTLVVSSLQTSLTFERQATLPNADDHDTSTSIITPYLAIIKFLNKVSDIWVVAWNPDRNSANNLKPYHSVWYSKIDVTSFSNISYCINCE